MTYGGFFDGNRGALGDIVRIANRIQDIIFNNEYRIEHNDCLTCHNENSKHCETCLLCFDQETLETFKETEKKLRHISDRLEALDYLLSGDDDKKSYLERLKVT